MIQRIHQIEITSQCNLRCKYCVHPKMKREKLHMKLETFKKAIELAKHCVAKYGQTELNLCGIGESTMHPQFIEFLAYAREQLPSTALVIASNGVKLKEEQVAAMQKYNLNYFVSLHRPEVAGPAIELAKKYNVLRGISADPSIAAIDWAGQVDWHTSSPPSQCPWLTNQQVMVTADGNLTSCCLDGDGVGIIGTVDSDIEKLEVVPYSLCKDCNHTIPDNFRR